MFLETQCLVYSLDSLRLEASSGVEYQYLRRNNYYVSVISNP